MFGAYPKPLKYKSAKVAYLCECLGRTLVSYILDLDIKKILDFNEDSSVIELATELYKARYIDCGIGIAIIQFTAVGGHGVSVAESLKAGDFDQAIASSNWWRDVEAGRIDPLGW